MRTRPLAYLEQLSSRLIPQPLLVLVHHRLQLEREPARLAAGTTLHPQRLLHHRAIDGDRHAD